MKAIEDEIDWKLLDQLHGVVAQISSFCFEVKKFCITTLIAAISFVTTITSKKLDHSVFVIGILIPLGFWFLDATGYYYQAKLRGTMEIIKTRLAKRAGKRISSPSGLILTHPRRTPWSARWQRAISAGFNHSMWIYLILIVADLFSWMLFCAGHIK